MVAHDLPFERWRSYTRLVARDKVRGIKSIEIITTRFLTHSSARDFNDYNIIICTIPISGSLNAVRLFRDTIRARGSKIHYNNCFCLRARKIAFDVVTAYRLRNKTYSVFFFFPDSVFELRFVRRSLAWNDYGSRERPQRPLTVLITVELHLKGRYRITATID